MIPLNLPNFPVKVAGTQEHPRIFDILRRRYVALTPEEWVRQHFVHFLTGHKGYPASLMANEIHLQVGDKSLRADTVVYDRALHPRMIIEYKAPTISLSQSVFDQISTYNLLLRVDYLIVSNGLNHYCCRMDYIHQKYLFLEDIPDYQNI